MFSTILRWIKNYLAFIGFLCLCLMIVLWQSASSMARRQSIEEKLSPSSSAVLHLTLNGQIKEGHSQDHIFNRVFSELMGKKSGPHLLDLKDKLQKAADDERIKGLFLQVEGLSGAMAQYTELRALLESFKEKKKSVFVWFSTIDSRNYYLASIADEIYMAPVGQLMIPGPVVELFYFGEALRKLGIAVDVLKVGKYKSAFERFVRNEPSSDSASMYQAMEQSLRRHFVQSVAKGRKNVDESAVAAWFKKSLYTAEQAKQAGIIDDLMYLDQLKAYIEEKSTSELFKFQDYESGPDLMASLQKAQSNEDGIALIEAVGEIHMDQQNSKEAIVPKQMAKELNWAKNNERVKAVVLRISSPGGSAVASDLIWDRVRQLAASKPVVVSMGAYAASGGYYIAAPATKIFASETTITGSIGVIGMYPHLNDPYKKYGISFHSFTGSDRKDLFNFGRKASEQDRAIAMEGVQDIYNKFITKVAKGRSMKVDQVHKIAQGRVWTGSQALKIGLVDKIGGLEQALAEAKKLAGFDSKLDYPILKWKQPIKSISDCLANPERCFPAASMFSYLGLGWEQDLARWQKELKTEPIQALWPHYLLN